MGSFQIIDLHELTQQDIAARMLVNSSIQELEAIILEIDSRDQTSDFQGLKNLCLELVKRLPLSIRTFDGNYILRARKNGRRKRDGKWEIFWKESEIGYNPNPNSWGRFNKNDESVFYGTSPMKTHNNNGSLTAIMETCKELVDENNLTLEYFFTVSRWIVVKKVNIVQLTFYSQAELQNPLLPYIHDSYLSFLRSSCSHQDAQKILRFYNYFAVKAARVNPSMKDYFISTAFYHAIREFYGDSIGIQFSSAGSENTGLNVCFTKFPVDNKMIQPWDVAMFRARRTENSMKSWDIRQCSDLVPVDMAGNFFLQSALHVNLR